MELILFNWYTSIENVTFLTILMFVFESINKNIIQIEVPVPRYFFIMCNFFWGKRIKTVTLSFYLNSETPSL